MYSEFNMEKRKFLHMHCMLNEAWPSMTKFCIEARSDLLVYMIVQKLLLLSTPACLQLYDIRIYYEYSSQYTFYFCCGIRTL